MLRLPISFRKLYRLSKEAFSYVLEEIKGEFRPTRARRAITPKSKLAATLRFLAQGSYQASVGQDLTVGVAQQTISDILAETLEILERKMIRLRVLQHRN